MDLARVPGVSAEWKAALESAGVRATTDLARATGLDDLAQRTGIPAERLEGLREAARRRVIAMLRDAGVTSEQDLAAADPADLAQRSGIPQADVEWFQAAARETLAGLPPRRVTMRPGVPLARVRLEEDVLDGVPVRTLGEQEEPGAALAAMDGNVVLLRAGQPFVAARVHGALHEEMPLYAESKDGEVAVRVAEFRTFRPGAPKKEKRGLFGRKRK